MYRLFDWLQNRSPWVRRHLNRAFYNYLAMLDRSGSVTLLNYGYAGLDPDIETLPLLKEDPSKRGSFQLYHHVCRDVDLTGQDVLEVGSGRGGGALFVKRYLGPRTITGVDYSKNAVEFCQRFYHEEGLHFVLGDAENLPLPDAQFDAVINVESSHCYGDMERFLCEVWRVLKPGGHLLWADHRKKEGLGLLNMAIQNSRFDSVLKEIITPNVLKSMKVQGQRNRELIDRHVPKVARQIFYHFSGLEGTHIYHQFASGESVYIKMILQKKKTPRRGSQSS